MQLNVKPDYHQVTHEGGPAVPHMTAEQTLRRVVLSCLLWEDQFYVDGQKIADLIEQQARAVAPETLAALAIEAREKFNLRHVPLLLLAVLAHTGRGVRNGQGTRLVAETIERVISRADELAEFLIIHARVNGMTPDKLKPTLSAGVKRGLGAAFKKFGAYHLAKYDRGSVVKLHDVLRLVHPKPDTEEQAAFWRDLKDGTLPAPDTWEVALSSGADKRQTFERLIRDGSLGYLALLRNLRLMSQVGVDETLVRDAILARRGAQRVLPFHYVAAARAAPQYEPYLDQALLTAISLLPELGGTTVVLVDVSQSMEAKLSTRSDLTRIDAAAALASLIHGTPRVFSFSETLVEVPARRGMAGIDAVIRSQPHWGTELGAAITKINAQVRHDRLIVITDEQSSDRVPDPVVDRAYLINVASYRNGIGYGRSWLHLDGFSEQVIRFIHDHEAATSAPSAPRQ